MTLTIKTINDIDKLKIYATHHPNQPLCYVYYKNNLLYPNVYYVGYTTTNCYKYLRNHHKMKRIIDRINNGYCIQIYTKYNENDLITFFEPRLNIAYGNGICGRRIGGGKLKTVGEITDHNYLNNYIKPNKHCNNYDVIWDNLFINKELDVYINFNIVLYIIDQNKIKIKHTFDNDNELFNKIIKMHKYYNIKNPFVLNDLLSILQFCNINCVFNAYMIITSIYKKYIYTITYSKHSLLLFNNTENVLNVYKEIIIELSNNKYFIDNFNKQHNQLSHFYKRCMCEEFNLFINNKLNKNY
jgi:hypothetical protein